MWSELRLVLRTIRRQPLPAVIVIITLALGIGVSTAIFTVFNAVLLRDLPYPDSDQIYVMNSVLADGSPTGPITPVELRPFHDAEGHPIVQSAALAWSQEVQIIGSDKKAYPTYRYGVTDQFFEVFGSQLYLGKPFKRGQTPGVIVLSYQIWRDKFASDPDIVGKSIVAEGGPMQVVGVTRPDFEFPENPGYWYLMNLGTHYDNVRGYRGFVRLKPGCSGRQFQQEATELSRKLGMDPATNRPSVLIVRPFLEYVVGNIRPKMMILVGATAILLLIACINVAHLMLSRAMVSSREMALREALGARRRRIIRQFLTESIFLSAAGGVLGSLCAIAGVRALLRIAPPGLPRFDRIPIDSTVLIFAAAVTMICGIVVGLVPAWRLSRNHLSVLVNEGGRGTPGGPRKTRVLSILVVAEVGLAVILVIGAGLLVRSYFNLAGTDPGFNPDGVLTLFMHVPGRVEYSMIQKPGSKPEFKASYAPIGNFFRELLERIDALPGVETVAATTTLPLHKYQYGRPTLFTLPDQPGASWETRAQSAVTESVSPSYFRALGIDLLAGRPLLSSDRPGSPGAAAVNETFARRFLAGQNPLGQRIRFPDNYYAPTAGGFQFGHRLVDELSIVGVVKDVRYMALADPPEPRIYLADEQWINRRRTVVVRTTTANPESLIEPIRKEIASMDPLLTAEFALYPSVVRSSLVGERLAATLLVIFGAAALALAAIGIYGLVSYSVAQRVGEIAVRSAMGASARQVITLVLGRGVRLALGGIVIGVFGAIALRQVLASQLHGVSPIDAGVFTLASLVLFSVALLACFAPARRATRIAPAELLRTE